MILKALSKNKNACDNLYEIMSAFVERGAVGDKVFWLSVCRSMSIEGQGPEIFNIHLVVDLDRKSVV